MKANKIPLDLMREFRDGVVIPALPLALNQNRSFDEIHERALVRYYIDAGVGGLAVGVHSTQFEIRDAGIDLFETVLAFASQEIDQYCEKQGKKILKIAGVVGKTEQALREAEFAVSQGYHAVLLSLSAYADGTIDEMLEHSAKVAEVIPVIGFYLQTAVGGRVLPYEFWRKFVEIDNVIAVKMAPFNRYQTFDVVRAVAEAGKENDIVLYTGNDDNILVDLLTPFKVRTSQGEKTIRIMGGLLGHWGMWTQKSVELMQEVKTIREKDQIPVEMLTRAAEVTDANAAFFDVANGFAGCIPGIHEVLRRQGLLQGIWCLDPHETLSPGQSEEIDRVYASYPHLNDDKFVKANLHNWVNKGE